MSVRWSTLDAFQRNTELRLDLLRQIGGPLTDQEVSEIRERLAWEAVDEWLETCEDLRSKPVRRFLFQWLVLRELRQAIDIALDLVNRDRTQVDMRASAR